MPLKLQREADDRLEGQAKSAVGHEDSPKGAQRVGLPPHMLYLTVPPNEDLFVHQAKVAERGTLGQELVGHHADGLQRLVSPLNRTLLMVREDLGQSRLLRKRLLCLPGRVYERNPEPAFADMARGRQGNDKVLHAERVDILDDHAELVGTR
jgi:hypothetical protein